MVDSEGVDHCREAYLTGDTHGQVQRQQSEHCATLAAIGTKLQNGALTFQRLLFKRTSSESIQYSGKHIMMKTNFRRRFSAKYVAFLFGLKSVLSMQ